MTVSPERPMVVEALLPSGAPYRPPTGPLRIVHQDDALLVVDKPSGLLSVPGRGPGLDDCLENRLRARHPEALLLHRLDMDTSGVMLFARSKEPGVTSLGSSMPIASRRPTKPWSGGDRRPTGERSTNP